MEKDGLALHIKRVYYIALLLDRQIYIKTNQQVCREAKRVDVPQLSEKKNCLIGPNTFFACFFNFSNPLAGAKNTFLEG